MGSSEPSPLPQPDSVGTKALAETISAILAALTAAAALIVIPGSVAILLRLHDVGLPADLGVVVSLPSELLFAIGFGYVLVPLLGILGLAIPLVVLSSRPQSKDRANLWIAAGGNHWAWLRDAALMLGAWAAIGALFAILIGESAISWPLVVVVGLGFALGFGVRSVMRKESHTYGTRNVRNVLLFALSGALVAGLPFAVSSTPSPLAFVVSWLTVLLWLFGCWLVARAFSDNDFRPVTAVGLFALAGLFFLPWTVAFAVNRGGLPKTTVCTEDGQTFDGRLVGETENRVYVGEPAYQVVSLVEDAALEEQVSEAFEEDEEVYDYFHPVPPVDDDLVESDLVLGDRELDEETSGLLDASGVEFRPVTDASEVLELAKDALSDSPRADRILSLPSERVTRVFIGGYAGCPRSSPEAAQPPGKGASPSNSKPSG